MTLDWLLGADWEAMFVPRTAILEIVIRGTLVYFALYTLLRVLLKRQTGSMEVTDLLVIVLIADAAQNAMAGEYRSVPDGVILVATIIAWSTVMDWADFHFPRVRWILRPRPAPLVEGGELVRENMLKEYVTEDELRAQLRLHGVQSLEEVDRVLMESNGQVSIVKKGGEGASPHRREAF